MRRHGLAELARIIPGGHTEEAGATAARLLLDGGSLPAAVVTFNDDSALGMLEHARPPTRIHATPARRDTQQ
jgi:DNA-binding LacI/PurR family transcriptional regulator